MDTYFHRHLPVGGWALRPWNGTYRSRSSLSHFLYHLFHLRVKKKKNEKTLSSCNDSGATTAPSVVSRRAQLQALCIELHQAEKSRKAAEHRTSHLLSPPTFADSLTDKLNGLLQCDSVRHRCVVSMFFYKPALLKKVHQ